MEDQHALFCIVVENVSEVPPFGQRHQQAFLSKEDGKMVKSHSSSPHSKLGLLTRFWAMDRPGIINIKQKALITFSIK
jgi:hypothetical protein